MKYVWIYVLMSWLLVKFYVLPFTPAQLEYTAVVDVNGDPTSLNCPEDAIITIVDASINTEGYCETAPCIIDNIDNEVLRGLCDNSTKCLIYRSNFSSACLEEQRSFNLSYVCEAPTSLDCNFETDLLCNWEQGTDDDFNWTRNSGKTDSRDTGPDSDHTTNSDNGFYMYIEASAKPRNLRAELISRPLLCIRFQCLTFWYHMFGDHIGSLSVYQKYKTEKRKRWRKKDNKGNQWILASVELICDNEFQIIIEANTKDDHPTWSGDIALDDIHAFEGKCDDGSTEICNFEQYDSCGLNNAFDKPDYIPWYIVQGKDTKKGPAVDHTIQSEEGFLFHLEALETSGKGRLDSIAFTYTGLHCLTIWYYIIGNSTNYLKLFHMSDGEINEIISVSGNSGKKWKQYAVSVDIAHLDQIIIEGLIKHFGSISFDDITFSKGACKEDEVYNNFCIRINQQYSIDGCATFFLQSESLNVALHPSLTNSNNEIKCIDKEDDIGRKLENYCREHYMYTNCRINLEHLFPDGNECFGYKKRILITYLCTVSDESVSLPTVMKKSRESDTGLVVGLVIGGLLLACVVIVIVVFLKRQTIVNGSKEKGKNNLHENDYIGCQDIALPHTADNSGLMQLADKQTSNDDEYAVINPSAETSFNEVISDGNRTADSYMILDPNDTGFKRPPFSNTPGGYEFAKPVKEKNNGDDDQYAVSEGVYDHSGKNRHKESEDNIYNHAVDTIYDSGSHKRNDEGREDTYDHFFGQTTEDDYDISTTT